MVLYYHYINIKDRVDSCIYSKIITIQSPCIYFVDDFHFVLVRV